jgi:tellurite resistance protein TerA
MAATFTRGQKGKLADFGLPSSFPVILDIAAPGMTVDVSCFGLDANGKLADDRYMVFYNQKSAPGEAVLLEQQGNRAIFRVSLERLPASIERLVFTAAVSGDGSMSALGCSSLTLGEPPALVFHFSGEDFVDEKAVIVGELYRREGSWRFGAVGQGFAGGLSALLKHFGGTEVAEQPKPVSLSKITLEKRGDKVSLDKRAGQGYGRIRINLNWHQGAPGKEPGGVLGKLFGQAGRAASAVDLDLGCLYEMANGKRGAIQALGESWGAYERPPYIQLDKDDRTGSVEGGENLYINGDHFDELRRVLVYAFIYTGVPNWAATDAVVAIEVPGQPTVEVRLDNGKNEPMCAIALLENQGGRLQVTKLVEYFASSGTMSAHQAMDQRFGFGLTWKRGTKN